MFYKEFFSSNAYFQILSFNNQSYSKWGFPHSSVSKESACNAGDQVQFLGQEDPLGKEMAIHSNILAWRIPRTEEPSGLQSMGFKESYTTERLSFSLFIKNGNDASRNRLKKHASGSTQIDVVKSF